jgi:uncharacterized tellurite resistance protein B-like protein
VSGFLRALLGSPAAAGGSPVPATPDRRLVAAAALMVEAARLDGSFSADERARVGRLLEERLGLGREVAAGLLGEAEAAASASADWHGSTSAVKDGFDHAGRVALVEMLWEVAYVDGELHDYEASLIRRVVGLLYVGDGESAEARGRALARLRAS